VNGVGANGWVPVQYLSATRPFNLAITSVSRAMLEFDQAKELRS